MISSKPTTLIIKFWQFFVFQYNFDSPQVKRSLPNCVPYVLTDQRALHAYLLTWQCALHAYVLTGQRALRVSEPCVLTCSRALRAYVLTCLSACHAYGHTCRLALRTYVQVSRTHVPCVHECPRAITSNHKNKFSMICFT